MKFRVSALLAAAVVGIGGCTKPQTADLTARVLFTARGSYDAQADSKTKIGSGHRRAVWTRQPPLAAGGVTLDYGTDSRPVAWSLALSAPRISVQTLLDENPGTALTVKMPQGQAQLFASGRLNDVLAVPLPDGLRLVTRAYATQLEPALLPLFGTAANP